MSLEHTEDTELQEGLLGQICLRPCEGSEHVSHCEVMSVLLWVRWEHVGHAYREVLQLLALRLLMFMCESNHFDLLRTWILKGSFTKERVYLTQEIPSELTHSYSCNAISEVHR